MSTQATSTSSSSSTTNVASIINYGSTGILVDIECHFANSLPNIVIVGAGGRNVDEAKERLRGAFSNSSLDMPRKRISINLAPADVPKDSSSLDLPIAVAILAATGRVSIGPDSGAFIGELGLDGSIRPVRGIIGKLLSGRQQGFRRFCIPAGNLEQARIVPNIELLPVDRLDSLYAHLTGTHELDWLPTGAGQRATGQPPVTASSTGLHDIVGQTQAKRALAIAAAGGHNVLLSGPPGTGKSMLAKALASLLPDLTHEEVLEVTHLHSLSTRNYDKLVTSRPVRAPHHSASHVAVVGGGNAVRPGEISLAHRGVLFFDELPEFDRPTIEALRQPLEDRTITVSRAKESADFPANFIFVATANPCPCGFYGTSRRCSCPAHVVKRYQQKLSGPLLDRIDLCVTVEHIEHDRLLATPDVIAEKDSTSIKRLVLQARNLQAHRFQNDQKLNSDMDNRDIKQLANLEPAAKAMLDTAGRNLNLSARAYMRSLKVARTIADLAGSLVIKAPHISEALQYRTRPTR